MDNKAVRLLDIKTNLKYFSILFAILFLFSFAGLFIANDRAEVLIRAEIERYEAELLDYESKTVVNDLRLRINDLQFLENAFSRKLLYHSAYNDIANEWRIYADYKGIYDQIRFIDAFGNEKIRINYSENGSIIARYSNLQYKGDRYYFTETKSLSQAQIYISPIDLNVENGQVEEPIKPMVRLSTPIFDEDGNFFGIIILNYLVDSFLNEFRLLADYSEGETFLLNSDSYWLVGNDPNLNWAFMYEDKQDLNFKTLFPKEWKKMQQSSGLFTSENGLYLYKTIGVEASAEDESLINSNDLFTKENQLWIISFIDLNSSKGEYYKLDLFSRIKRTFGANQAFFAFILLTSVIGSILLSIIQQLYLRTKYLSEHDAFTGAFNRTTGFQLLKKQTQNMGKRKIKTCLCFLDINGLKSVNDTLGHNIGDELILTVVNIINGSIRSDDYLIRLGGDEFVIVSSNISIAKAELLWERITNKIDKINQKEKRAYLISVSHGIIEYKPDVEPDIDVWITKADLLMYREKRRKKKGEIIIRESK